MISRFLIVCISLTSTLVTSQITKEGYVGFNIGGSLGGSGASNFAKSYEKSAYVDGGASHSGGLAGNAAGSIAVDVPAPAVQSSIYFEKNIQPVNQVEYKPAPTLAPVEVIATPVQPVQPVQQNVYVRKVHRRPAYRKHYYVNAEVGAPPPPRVSFLTKLFSVNAAPAPGPVVQTEVDKEFSVPKSTVQHNVDTTYTATANVNKNGQLFTDIFNIPIQTLQAVNRLVNNVVGGVSINKQVNTYATKTVSANADVHSNAEANLHSNSNANAYLHAEGNVQA